MKYLTSLVAAVLLALAVPASAQDNPLSKVADGVFHFFAMGYSSMVVVGDNGVLITDPSFTARAELLKTELAKVTDKPVTHVALSHEHFDHIGGTEVFDGAEIIMQENGIDVLELSPLMPTPEVSATFDEALTVDLGGQTVELRHIAVGDGVATTVARVRESNVVFSADLYMPKEFSPHEFKEDTNFVGLGVILNTLVQWNPSYAINAHSAGNSAGAIQENAELLSELQAIVKKRFEEAFASGDPAAPWSLLFTISGEIEMQKYENWKKLRNSIPGICPPHGSVSPARRIAATGFGPRSEVAGAVRKLGHRLKRRDLSSQRKTQWHKNVLHISWSAHSRQNKPDHWMHTLKLLIRSWRNMAVNFWWRDHRTNR